VLELYVASSQNLVTMAVHELVQLHVCFSWERQMPATQLEHACARSSRLSVESRKLPVR
jgi:hypothetical protein